MEPHEHPAFAEENSRLAATAASMDAELALLRDRTYDGYPRVAAITKARLDRERITQIETAANSPYFHRTDAVIDGAEQTIYIGRLPLTGEGAEVIAWQADIAALRFSTERAQSFHTPSGIKNAEVQLQRKLDTRGRALRDITDLVDYRVTSTLTPEEVDRAARDRELENLTTRLKERQTPGLHDIVETMQQRQDQLVRLPTSQVLVVDGSAGSGKTSIAYHRIAYLRYRWQQHAPDRPLSPVVVFAPNKLFLSYVHNIQSELGVAGIEETTFEVWAMERMGLSAAAYELIDPTLATMLDTTVSPDVKDALWRRSRLVSSREMIVLIHRYVTARAQDFNPAHPFEMNEFVEGRMLSLSISVDQARELHGRAFRKRNRPFDDQWQQLRDSLVAELEAQIAEQLSLSLMAQLHINEGAVARRTAVERWLTSALPPIRIPQDYYAFVRNQDLLESLSQTIFDTEECALIAAAPRRTASQLVREDIAPLLELSLLATGGKIAPYGHVVVDEAQDYSIAQIDLIRRVSGTSSFTLLGDVAQSIYAYRGIDDWGPLTGVFAPTEVRVETIDVNYRSTEQIVQVANRVLAHAYAGSRGDVRGIGRQGDEPQLLAFDDTAAQYDYLAERIFDDIVTLDRQTVAVIGKTHHDCETAYRELLARDVTVSHNWVAEEGSYAGGLAVLTVSAAKGLEFDSVYVVEADASRYSAEAPYDARLLYVAITRALDALSVLAVGELTPLLR